MGAYETALDNWQEINVTKHPHRYLTREDRCWFLSDEGLPAGAQQLIEDLEGRNGENAQAAAVLCFAQELGEFAASLAAPRVILVPMTPTKRVEPSDADFLQQMCECVAAENPNVYVAQLLDPRLAAAKLDEGDLVVVVDDVVESGAHFKTAKRYLKAVFDANVIGAFLSRIPPRYEKQRVVVREDFLEEDIVAASFGEVPKYRPEPSGIGSRISGALGRLFGKK